ncbi:E3 ubiquitin-protein ligase TRIM11-like [Liolophura sinensis]|uniref:E3 ubiquitin-protein ligase TRIM11-like n=1 Tax=Liolophura sinensis TaxID=3198878 RepID=UPI0031599278
MCELQENLTCAICVDHFRDPVKLPCQHTYCRECIRTHAEKSKPKETYDTSELSTIPKKEWLIYCPLCRKEASLGKDGVDDLPNNIYLCGMADRSRSLETVEEGACAETPENTVDQDLCMTHESALIMYCETCPKLICLECLEEHERHLISSTKAAYRNLKEPIQKKAEECEVFKDELACLVSETESLLKEIRENENTHRTEIESAYNEGLDVLNTWRRDALNRIENRHLPLTNKTERVLAELPVKMAEIEKMIQEALDLPTSLTGTFLQMSRDLTSRMDVHLSNAPDFLKDQRKVKKTVAETLKLDPAAPLNLDVKLNVRPMKGMTGKPKRCFREEITHIPCFTIFRSL